MDLCAAPPNAQVALGSDGKVYSYAFASQTLGLYVNNEVFKKAGLTPPTTWAELVAACDPRVAYVLVLRPADAVTAGTLLDAAAYGKLTA